jgi:hypothetical protein
MARVALGLAVLSAGGVVLLLLAYAELRRRILAVESYLTGVARPPADLGGLRSLLIPGVRSLFVLVTDDRCISCHDRVRELELLVTNEQETSARTVAIVKSSGRFDRTVAGIRYLVDANLIASLRPSATPQVIEFDDSGKEVRRRVVGSEAELCDLWTDSNATRGVIAAGGTTFSEGRRQ